ncbi:MAG: hypothetical protein CSH37_11905 [Thalassolituus sp.]|jgi:GTPase SAR1 family protein|uniref:Uncharacterized protein n=1 Tax=Thalassolituus maritimus TaxID=484498 RepID=A0ABQ0A089_9GAMM|nr:MAG: hypothetical protein CSH37_11905 [Thalassolituus sp.]
MKNDLFSQVKNLSLELRSLIRQGVKEGVDERIQKRNELMQQWFAEVSDLIDLTNEQQVFLEDLLKEEQELLEQLKAEQQQVGVQQQGQKNVKKYLM